MEENYYNPPEENIEAEVIRENANTNESKKADSYVAIIIMQAVVCGIILLIFIIIKFAFGDYFSKIKDWYNNNVNVDTDLNQVLNDDETAAIGGDLNEIYVSANAEMITPIKGTVSSNCGYRTDPFTGDASVHRGIDIAAEEGTEICAAFDGKIVTCKISQGDYGNYIIIDHGGFYTLYGHCSKLLKKEGETVKAGEKIALCGSTGRSTGAHLHFEIRVGGMRIDPSPFLKLGENQ